MGISKKEIDDVLSYLKKTLPPKNGYSYFLPSPHEGKRLLITGWISPGEAAEIATKIWKDEAKISDFENVEEID